MVISDFNLPVENNHLEAIIQAYNQLFQTFESGLSDHHKLICAILKSGGLKGGPIEKIHRSYKTFDSDQFQEILKIKLENIKSKLYGDFETVFLRELNKRAPLKKKFLRHNKNPFMTKNLRKQIMVQSKLRQNFNKNRNYENWYKYKRQRNPCLNLLRKTKKNFFFFFFYEKELL